MRLGAVAVACALTQAGPREDQAGHQTVDGKVGKNFSREPQLGEAGVVEGGVAGGQGGPQVLVQRGHDDDGERGVEEVVAPHKYVVIHTLHTAQGPR